MKKQKGKNKTYKAFLEPPDVQAIETLTSRQTLLRWQRFSQQGIY